MCKVVGAVEFSNLAHDICRVKIRKKWRIYLYRSGFGQFTLQSAQRHKRKLAKFSKKSVQGGRVDLAEPGQVARRAVSIVRCSKCTIQNSTLGVPQLHFLSNLGVLASFSHSHMTNKQEYEQKNFLKHLYQQYVKLEFCEKW